jgi:hypothetical protein
MLGPCVESVTLENVPGAGVRTNGAVQPGDDQVVLEGQQTAKFLIRGRHLWARVYVPSSQLV